MENKDGANPISERPNLEDMTTDQKVTYLIEQVWTLQDMVPTIAEKALANIPLPFRKMLGM